MNIKEIVNTCGPLYKQPYIKDSNDASNVKKAEKYIKANIEKIANECGLTFNKQGFSLRVTSRKSHNIYKHAFLCRLTYDKDSSDKYFQIFIQINNIDKTINVNIDKNETKLRDDKQIYQNSDEYNEYDKKLNDKIKEFSSLLEISYDNYHNYRNVESFTSDTEIFNFIKEKLIVIKPIYLRLLKYFPDLNTTTAFEEIPYNITPINEKIIFKEYIITNLNDLSSINKDNKVDYTWKADYKKLIGEEIIKVKLGEYGETKLNELLMNKLDKSEISFFEWVSSYSKNSNSDDTKGYDFKIVKDNIVYYLEVKTTRSDNNQIYLSENEYECIDKYTTISSKYYLCIVNLKLGSIYYIDGSTLKKSNFFKPCKFKLSFKTY